MSDPQLMLQTKMLGAMLREARLKSGRTLRESASAIGTTSGKLSSFEHGRKGISLPELELLAYSLEVPLQRFLEPASYAPESRRKFDPNVVIALRQRMLGATLKRHRLEAELSQRQLAESVGFPVSRIGAYERGDRAIPLPELRVLIKALGKSLTEYIDSEGPIAEWNRKQQAFEAFLKLPEDVRALLSKPEHQNYLRLSRRLADLPAHQLRAMGELLLAVSA